MGHAPHSSLVPFDRGQDRLRQAQDERLVSVGGKMLDGQIALVTGATRGIGKAIALELARQGASVVGTSTTDAGAAAISAYLREAGARGEGIRLDLTDSAGIEPAVRGVGPPPAPRTVPCNT